MDHVSLSVLLMYEPQSAAGRPVPLARVTDSGAILQIARAAIQQAQRRAAELDQADEVLGTVERAEVDRLRNVLNVMVPGLLQQPDTEAATLAHTM